jgi:hypothetical protein
MHGTEHARVSCLCQGQEGGKAALVAACGIKKGVIIPVTHLDGDEQPPARFWHGHGRKHGAQAAGV